MFILDPISQKPGFAVKVIRVGTKPYRTGNPLVSATALVRLSSEGEPITVELTGVDPEDIDTVIKVEEEFTEREFNVVGIKPSDPSRDGKVALNAVWFPKAQSEGPQATCFFVDDPDNPRW